jgi:hypothetical protein
MKPASRRRLERLAAGGNVSAQVSLALFWSRKNKVTSFAWWRRAAPHDPGAAYQLAWCFREGRGTRRSLSRAFFWMRRSAVIGHSDAQYSLAFMYAHGLGVARNHRRAVHWYRRAAGNGDLSAMYNLAVRLSQGLGVRRNSAEAIEWYRRAARRGDADARHNLKLLLNAESASLRTARQKVPRATR